MLELKDLWVVYPNSRIPAVRGFSFSLPERGRLAVVGESGSGKSTLVRCLMRILPAGTIERGVVRLAGKDVRRLHGEALRQYRWGEVSLVPQGVQHALNPMLTLAEQVAEALVIHRRIAKKEALEQAGIWLERVGLEGRDRRYPWECSGGMKQRAVIAMALAVMPRLLIMDEPTSALDMLTQGEILRLVRELAGENSFALMLISHDLHVVASLAEQLIVMYGGCCLEKGKTMDILDSPRHPYTQLLLESYPRKNRRFFSGTGEENDTRLELDADTVSLVVGAGCPFFPRCKHSAGCPGRVKFPPWKEENGRGWACFRV